MTRKSRPRRSKLARTPDLGRLELCLNVKNLARSAAFYENLGFRQVAGSRRQNWAIMERDGARIDLFHGYITTNMMNFRGGDVGKIVNRLEAAGIRARDVKLVSKEGAGRATIRDPDGNVVFFDTTPRERTLRRQKSRGK